MTVAMLMKNTVQSAQRSAARLRSAAWNLRVLPLALETPVPRYATYAPSCICNSNLHLPASTFCNSYMFNILPSYLLLISE
jgi:hypothetical protein